MCPHAQQVVHRELLRHRVYLSGNLDMVGFLSSASAHFCSVALTASVAAGRVLEFTLRPDMPLLTAHIAINSSLLFKLLHMRLALLEYFVDFDGC